MWKSLQRAFVLAAGRPEVRLALILLFGLLLRLGAAFHPGYAFDVGVNQGWAWTGAVNGVTTSYTAQLNGTMIPDYPPFSLMLFTAVGILYRQFSPEPGTFPVLFRVLIKLPAILADLAVILAAYGILARIRNRRAGLLAALIAALHPALWFDSSVWGQTDSIFSALALFSALSLARERSLLGGALGALALLAKIHAVAFYPLFFIATRVRIKPILLSVAGGLATAGAVFVPFLLNGTALKAAQTYWNVIGSFKVVSANAYNFWWALLGRLSWERPDDILLLGPLSYRAVGLALVLGSFALVLWPLLRLLRAKRTNPRIRTEAVLAAGAACAFAFFLFNTEMHERYLFPFTVFGLPLVFFHRKFLLPYWGATLAHLFNMVNVLRPWEPLGRLFDALPALSESVASLQIVFFILLLLRVRSLALRVQPMPFPSFLPLVPGRRKAKK